MGGRCVRLKPKVKTFRFYRVLDSNKASGFRADGRAEGWVDRWDGWVTGV